MEALDGTVKLHVQQDSMVIYVRRRVSVVLTCVIKRLVVSHDIMRQQ